MIPPAAWCILLRGCALGGFYALWYFFGALALEVLQKKKVDDTSNARVPLFGKSASNPRGKLKKSHVAPVRVLRTSHFWLFTLPLQNHLLTAARRTFENLCASRGRFNATHLLPTKSCSRCNLAHFLILSFPWGT